MSDYSSLLERRAGTLAPPDDSFRRTLDRYHDRQRRRRRNRRAASAALGILMSAAGFVAALRAFGGDSTPARRPLPPPIGVAPPSVGPVRSIQPLTPSRAVALTRHAVILTTDGGRHWADVSPRRMASLAASSVRFLDRDHGWIVGIEDGFDPPAAVTVFRTRDGGGNWQRTAFPAPRQVSELLDGQVPRIGFSDPSHGWMWFDMVSPSPLLLTSDGGASWHQGSVMRSRDQVKSLVFTSARDAWAVREHDVAIDSRTDLEIDELYRSSDGGRTWHHVRLPGAPMPSESGRRGIELGVMQLVGRDVAVLPAWSKRPFTYISSNGGTSWFRGPRFPVRQGFGSPIFPEALVSPSVWFVGSTSGQFATTTDGGRNWSVRDLNDVFPRGPSALAFSSERTGWGLACRWYAGGLNEPVACPDGPSALWRTEDGGRTWALMLGTPRSSAGR